MGAPALLLAGTQVAGGILSAVGQEKAGAASNQYYQYLASNATANAKLATAAGEANVEEIGAQTGQAERMIQEKTATVQGAQRAGLVTGAGNSSRTAQDIASDTLRKSSLDTAALNYNAQLKSKAARLGAATQAFNYNAQAGGDLLAGKNAQSAANFNALGSILGSGTQVASTWYQTGNQAAQLAAYRSMVP